MKTQILKTILGTAVLTLAQLNVFAAKPTVESLLGQAQSAIETAAHTGNEESLDAAGLAIDKALVLDANNAWAWYYKGRAAYIQANIRGSHDDSVGKQSGLEEADKALEKSIALKYTAEALSLHSSVLGGLVVARGGEAAMQLGPRIGQELGEAEHLAPENPRVLMTAGISKLFTPAQWGGDVHEAKQLLEQAVAAFAHDSPPAPEPSWGKADAHVWLGLALQKLDKFTDAKKEFERALEIDPNYTWVKMVLLPNADHPGKL